MTADLREFRDEVRAFIRASLSEELRERVMRGYSQLEKADYVFWQRCLYERGWGAPSWPMEHGGAGWTAAHRQIFDDECARLGAPRTQPQMVKMIGPILCAHGTPEQQARFLPPILKGDEWWCQGYSEPGAGSDLAAISTRAERDGDHYVVTGQKVWTSFAHFSDWMFCLVRTEVAARKQEGITFLLIDMRSPGVEVRPIHTLDLAHHTNEVFLNEVRVPVENRIGEEGRGWTYAKALLAHERSGIAELGRARERFERIHRIVADPAIAGARLRGDAEFMSQLAQLEVEIMAAEATTLRLQESHAAPALSSVLKLRGSEITQRLTRLAVEALGPHALHFDIEEASRGPHEDDPLPSYATGRVPEYMVFRSLTIAGGSSEIQRNIIAKLAFGD
ncbi:acyl-CoA dehydrogenase family protein [Ottowia thiooxydans]|uniref:acyl-CoA dehydrogenase family protein n=1 Tax=Ottowia thiooxydans TaxID=219182 RepID=UPI00040346B4|nr:acyl-CoA dehydrogenase family protein [Ottowia thiooxydans]